MLVFFVVCKSTLILDIVGDTITSYQTGSPSTKSKSLNHGYDGDLQGSTIGHDQDDDNAQVYNQTSNFLLGLTAYGGGGGILRSNENLARLSNKDNVNVIGFGTQLSAVFPSNTDDAIQCCNTTEGLKQLISNGDACLNYAKNNGDYQEWSSNYWLNNSRNNGELILPFIYLKDSCNYYPEQYHCLGYQTGGGTPNLETSDELEWWLLLFQAYMNCTILLANELGDKSQLNDFKYHIWNEPNAHFWQNDKNGTYYEYFYNKMASNLKSKFSEYNLKFGGPVTWCPATRGNTWEDYFLPLFDMNHDALNSGNDLLLDFFDYHAYDSRGIWDITVTNINAINNYNWIYNKYNILTSITETNQAIANSSDFFNGTEHWQIRTLINAAQIIALSHYPNKIDERHMFDLNATGKGNHFEYWKTIDEYSYQVLKNLQNNFIIKQNLYDSEDKNKNKNNNIDAFYYNSKSKAMSQVVFNNETNKLYVYLINNSTDSVSINIQDSSNSVEFDVSNSNGDNMYATFNGIYTNVTISKINNSENSVNIMLKPLSIYQLSASFAADENNNYHENFKQSVNVEYNCDNTNTIMAQITSDYNNVKIDCQMYISDSSNLKEKSIVDGYFRVGIVGVGASAYNWTIDATTTSGNQNGMNITFNTNQIQYNEIYLDKSNNFLNEITLNDTVAVSISGETSMSPDEVVAKEDGYSKASGKYNTAQLGAADIIGRFGFISLVLRFE